MARHPRESFCGSPEHNFSRRGFLGGASALVGIGAGLETLRRPAMAEELKKKQKRVILLWLAGGASQLETWDPKPGRPTGGPFRSIQTSSPGIQISELMPKMASRLQDTAIIRSLNTRIGDHGGGSILMHLGRRDEPNLSYPDMGSVLARELGQADSTVPDYVTFYTATEGRGNAVGRPGFLGARYAPMFLTTSNKPEDIERIEGLSEFDHKERADLRKLFSDRFTRGRESAPVLDSHNVAYRRVHGLMASDKLFDVTEEPEKMQASYGPTLFGQQCLIARRLAEAGTPFIKVSRAWWDSHGQNFETHLELVTELDHVMSTLLEDLKQRGLLESTLVITLAEFGRTPKINGSLGRDHFANAWSASLSGCGIQGGSVFGKTDEDGQTVADGEIGAAEMFATIYKALGINPHKDYYVGARPIPLTDPGTKAVGEVLS
tara:strand:- start:1055 stop:2359 length:1305 start_codon:yes stop_codon:yes gene_type:complete